MRWTVGEKHNASRYSQTLAKMEILYRYGGLHVDCGLLWLGAMGSGHFHHSPTAQLMEIMNARVHSSSPIAFSRSGVDDRLRLMAEATPIVTGVLASRPLVPLWNASVQWLLHLLKSNARGRQLADYESRMIGNAIVETNQTLRLLPRVWLGVRLKYALSRPSMISDEAQGLVAFVEPEVASRIWPFFRLPFERDETPMSMTQCVWDGTGWRYFHPAAFTTTKQNTHVIGTPRMKPAKDSPEERTGRTHSVRPGLDLRHG